MSLYRLSENLNTVINEEVELEVHLRRCENIIVTVYYRNTVYVCEGSKRVSQES